MKKTILILVAIILIQNANSQTYFPFPTDTAQWNNLTWAQWSPSDFWLINSQYKQMGDTVINNLTYHKVFYYEANNPTSYEYIGALREDTTKDIYFYPSTTILPNYCGTQFPSDTTEYLLYTFDSLVPGMTLPINTGGTEIKVIEIDSVFLQNAYRKRYKIEQNSMFGYQYWIEGIGSTKDLFAPFSYEFEWELYTLCYTDSVTYYINSPNGGDSCHYSIPLSLVENIDSRIELYPNPTSKSITIRSNQGKDIKLIKIYNSFGQLIMQNKMAGSSAVKLNIEKFKPGLFVLEIDYGNRKQYLKFVKK